jgi:hypothetical protein
MPKVSVLMPTYNGEAYIVEAIESIRMQTFQDWELIVVDDGSRDNTVAQVAKFIQTDNRIRLIQFAENQGIPFARNAAVAAAGGLYLANLDSDDVALPQRFEMQVSFLDTHPEVGVCGAGMGCLTTGKLAFPAYHSHEAICAQLLFGSPIPNSSAMMRANLLMPSVPAYDASFALAQDYDLWERLSTQTRLHNLTEVLVYRRLHAQNSSTQNGSLLQHHTERIWQRQLQGLGLTPTPSALALHRQIVGDGLVDLAHLQAVDEWLTLLWEANQVRQRYPEPAFEHQLAQIWLRHFAGQTRLGLPYGRLFTQSRWSQYPTYGAWQRLKFWVKTVLQQP